MSENRIRSFKNKGKDSSVSLCPELYVKHCLIESCEKCAHSSNTSKSNDEFEVDRTLDRNVLIFNFILIESKLSWSNCDLVH